MAIITALRPRADARPRPSRPWRIDWSKPITRGLVRAFPLDHEMEIVRGEGIVEATPGNIPATPIAVPNHGIMRHSMATDFQYYTAATVPEISGVTAYSFSCWFRRRVITNGSPSFGQIDTGDFTKINQFYPDNDTLVKWIFDNSTPINANWVSNDTLLHHVVGCYNGNGGAANAQKIQVYFDGLMSGVGFTLNFTGTIPSTSPVTPSSFRLGYYQPGGSYPDGDFGDVLIWNRALSPGEAESLWDPATRWDYYARQPSEQLAALDVTAEGWLPQGHTAGAGRVVGISSGVIR